MKAWPLLIVLLLIPAFSCKQESQALDKERQAELSAHIATWIENCWNQRNLEVLEGLTTPDVVRYMNGVKVAEGTTELEAHLQVFFTAFPDLVISTGDIHFKDSLAFYQWNAQGPNTGIFGEVSPTGKRVNINGLSHLSFDHSGKIKKEVVYYNELELLQQLGYTLIPPNME